MEKLIFATSNAKKIQEVKGILGSRYEVLSLADINFEGEIPEPYDTIRENSIHKANFFFEKTNLPCIAEDSGLEVDALDGRPSAYSARYAGEERNDITNYKKVLSELGEMENRKARFISIITYKNKEREDVFEGNMEGEIAKSPRGSNGFGYDPIFIPDGYDKTNAELSPEEKNAISHRRMALDALMVYFSNL
jgi:XTP/dITP diphosphohydrolase